MYLTYNVLGLISLKGADLLFGQAPILRADERTAELSRTRSRASSSGPTCPASCYGCAVDASYEAESFLEACVHGGEVYLRQVPADEIFPDGELLPDGQYAHYVRYRVANVGTDAAAGVPAAGGHLPARPDRAPVLSARRGRARTRGAAWRTGAEPMQIAISDLTADVRSLVVSRSAIGNPATGIAPASPITGIPRNTITWVPNLSCAASP